MKVMCIKCWDEDAVVSMDLTADRVFRCGGCSEEFDRDDVRAALDAMVKGWSKLLKWVDAYPADEGEEEETPEGGK